MKILLWILLALAVVIVSVVVVGMLLPVRHTSSGSVDVDASVNDVWQKVSNVVEYPKWRSGITRVELVEDSAALVRFREHGSDGVITFAVDESVAPTRRVTRIADDALPFGGRWIIGLTPAGTRTTVRITEEGEVRNPVFRFMSRFVFGHEATIRRFLDDLRREFTRQ